MIRHHSRPYDPPACPHCGKELPDWTPPRLEPLWFFLIKFFGSISLAVAGILGGIAILFTWTSTDQTLVHVIAEGGRWLMHLFGRIW